MRLEQWRLLMVATMSSWRFRYAPADLRLLGVLGCIFLHGWLHSCLFVVPQPLNFSPVCQVASFQLKESLGKVNESLGISQLSLPGHCQTWARGQAWKCILHCVLSGFRDHFPMQATVLCD